MRADFSLDYDFVTVEQPKKLYLLARFEAGHAPGDQSRRPLNLSLVIDRSGSMAGDKIDYTRQAAQFLIQHLGASDIFSLVLYNDKVETMVHPEMVSNKDAIIQQLERIRVRGTTNLSGGWLEGCQHVKSRRNDHQLNRVILMSDGLANRGVVDTPALVAMAKQKREEGVTTTTMGLGKDFNEDLMMEMANAGGGAFYFIESPEVAPEIFKEELSGLLKIVGQNLLITFIAGEHVASVHQLNAYSETRDGKQTAFRLGDIFGNEVKTLVLELQVPALASLGEISIATLRFEYDDVYASGTQHHVKEFPVLVNVRADAVGTGLPNPEVTQSVLLLKAAQARQHAVKAADEGNYDGASKILQETARAIQDSGVMNDHLREERSALLEQAKQMEDGAEKYDEYSRKTMATQAMYTMTSRHNHTVQLRSREQDRLSKAVNQAEQDLRATLDQEVQAVSQSNVPLPPELNILKGIVPTHVRWNDREYALTGDLIRIGRASHNEIVVNEKGVSRFHSQIRLLDGRYVIEDLGSTNGTVVGGKMISAPYELSAGDEVFICDEKLVFLKKND